MFAMHEAIRLLTALISLILFLSRNITPPCFRSEPQSLVERGYLPWKRIHDVQSMTLISYGYWISSELRLHSNPLKEQYYPVLSYNMQDRTLDLKIPARSRRNKNVRKPPLSSYFQSSIRQYCRGWEAISTCSSRIPIRSGGIKQFSHHFTTYRIHGNILHDFQNLWDWRLKR